MDADEKEKIKELVRHSSAALSEHFDSVHIFVTRHDGGEENTISYEHGRGNFYARLGQIGEWLCIQEQFQRNEAIRRDKDE